MSYKNIPIYCIPYMAIKNSKYVRINGVNPLYLMLNKMNEYFEEMFISIERQFIIMKAKKK